jgi:hypothetical protein
MRRQSTLPPPRVTSRSTVDRPLACLHHRPDAAAQRAVSCVDGHTGESGMALRGGGRGVLGRQVPSDVTRRFPVRCKSSHLPRLASFLNVIGASGKRVLPLTGAPAGTCLGVRVCESQSVSSRPGSGGEESGEQPPVRSTGATP